MAPGPPLLPLWSPRCMRAQVGDHHLQWKQQVPTLHCFAMASLVAYQKAQSIPPKRVFRVSVLELGWGEGGVLTLPSHGGQACLAPLCMF